MLRLLLAVPLLVLLVLFALSNTAPVRIGLWPTDLGLVAPLSVAILMAVAAGLLAGALLTWFGALAQRRRARRAEARVRALDAEIEGLRARLQPPPTLPPPTLPPPA
ncbi:MAG: DUF1049 domain-containing protein [Acidisphaera sp.]|nr:DUF1049 domain-containing protein [Acidisphaera sp.]